MTEFYSRALVIGREESGEMDGVVHLFTEKYGKITARARSLRKITSKSSAHLQILQFIQVRFISSKKAGGGFIIMDVLWDENMKQIQPHTRYELLPVVYALNRLLGEFQTEPKLWMLLETAFRKSYNVMNIARVMLRILGFDPEHAQCGVCGKKSVHAFVVGDDKFICVSCTSQLPVDTIVLEV
ncbi:MAG: DNA repair protein RecO [Candidatus Paceibacterota bacterium]